MKKITFENIPYYRSIQLLRNSMVALNYGAVMFISTVILLGSQYVVQENLSKDFLEQIGHIPRDPSFTFFSCLFLYGLLAFIILSRDIAKPFSRQITLLGLCSEILITLIITYLLNMSYSGIMLLIFCDCIFNLKNLPLYKWIPICLVILFLLSNYEIGSVIFPLTNVGVYFEILPLNLRSWSLLLKKLLESLNILCFIAYLAVFISNQFKEQDNIEKELDMINQVNHELQNYAAITEKIGENNERKRLAREIHDTLGHALTGIAAGVDACIVMIDKSPQATKKQLELVSRVVRQGINDVRSSLEKLRPGALEEKGLKGALMKMTEEFTSVSDMEIKLDFEADNVDFDVVKEDVLFRLIQESITNSTRHGSADYIHIHLYTDEKNLMVDIEDNGIGCEQIKPGYGLLQMQERIASIHGSIQFDGSSGFSTHVIIPILKGERND